VLLYNTFIAAYIGNAKTTPTTAPEYWTWHDQKTWGGNCNSGVMQSPIDFTAPDPNPTAQTTAAFSIAYKFSDSINVEVKLNVGEVYVGFKDFAGGMKVDYGNGNMISYAITRMTFRFPAEHLINGVRLDGEIVLVGEEITDKNNRVRIILSIFRL
jgi:carbonic anhydrase